MGRINFDKYCYTDVCVEKLLKTYKERGYLIIAFDFDDTLISSEPDYECQLPLRLLSLCKEYINCKLILYTCRSSNRGDGRNLRRAIETCKNLGIEPDYVNEHAYEEFKGLDGKVFYDIFLDDKAGLGQACEILGLVINKILNNEDI
jgi:hypothetical protein